MATRAERFRSTTARQGAQKKNRPPKPAAGRPRPRSEGSVPAARNLSQGRKAVYALEDTLATKRPSRKSSRAGTNRVKQAAPLTSRQKLRVSSPASRHDRG